MADPLHTITVILPGSKGSCVLLRIVLEDAFSEVLKVCPPSRLEVFVDDTNHHVWSKNQEVLQAVPRVVCKLKKRSQNDSEVIIDRKRERR